LDNPKSTLAPFTLSRWGPSWYKTRRAVTIPVVPHHKAIICGLLLLVGSMSLIVHAVKQIIWPSRSKHCTGLPSMVDSQPFARLTHPSVCTDSSPPRTSQSAYTYLTHPPLPASKEHFAHRSTQQQCCSPELYPSSCASASSSAPVWS
jgi:hypothetical protein